MMVGNNNFTIVGGVQWMVVNDYDQTKKGTNQASLIVQNNK